MVCEEEREGSTELVMWEVVGGGLKGEGTVLSAAAKEQDGVGGFSRGDRGGSWWLVDKSAGWCGAIWCEEEDAEGGGELRPSGVRAEDEEARACEDVLGNWSAPFVPLTSEPALPTTASLDVTNADDVAGNNIFTSIRPTSLMPFRFL